mmetsp:Transcript_29509/g.28668  ORF Transcript_29509/g.28668 Transcript_29509/m.28668 type:complete len:120 (+) Transcript_29509:943-1302(+)
MANVSKVKISDPNDRYRRILSLFKYFENNEEFKTWGLEVSKVFTTVKAKVLTAPKVIEKNGEVNFDMFSSGKIKHTEPLHLQRNRWIVAYRKADFDNTTSFFETMQKASSRPGSKVEEP